ncbi:MAG: alpha/beta fold hydrolase [Rhodobacteraceae bacterium]|nr:alpha/beta fold hydrolase [Paracoccaceae bacterium]TVR47824.1 MAG: alpha/beta fold hydrolase [Paracoccaceae bacterium]
MQAPPPDWPMSACSHVIRCRPHEWHVQITGSGPDLLLLHGAGASAHSFHPLIPHLPGYRLIMPDLPGQGYTRAGGMRRLGLDEMAEDIAALCADQGWQPAAIIGHSAGGAVALRLTEILPDVRAVVGINAALGPFQGVAGWLFPKLARALAASPFVAGAVTRLSAGRSQVERLVGSMGSTISAGGITAYQRLVSRRTHIEGTLGMMAQWQLDPLLARLPQIKLPVLLIAAARDRAVPPGVSHSSAAILPHGSYAELPGFGHLVHEEAPEQAARLILPFLQAQGMQIQNCTGAEH